MKKNTPARDARGRFIKKPVQKNPKIFENKKAPVDDPVIHAAYAMNELHDSYINGKTTSEVYANGFRKLFTEHMDAIVKLVDSARGSIVFDLIEDVEISNCKKMAKYPGYYRDIAPILMVYYTYVGMVNAAAEVAYQITYHRTK
jgi:hypothetical protein